MRDNYDTEVSTVVLGDVLVTNTVLISVDILHYSQNVSRQEGFRQ